MVKSRHCGVRSVPGIEKLTSVVRFEDFELQVRSGELLKSGERILRLSEQPLRVLIALLEHPGEVVLREDLRKRLWPNDTVVEFEHGIGSAMSRLRQALGDSAEKPRFIETLARRGYRWKTEVEWCEVPFPNKVPARVSTQNLLGKRVGQYRVLEALGGGGMGVVYKAEDIKLGRRVALKFLPDELSAESVALERFRREARAASASDHPNICTVYEVGEHEGMPYIAMQFLTGESLSERIERKSGPLPLAELIALAIQVTEGLDAAHQRGIIHRDIKPANIFVTNRSEAKILDFGLAKLTDSAELAETTVAARANDRAHPDEVNLTRAGTPVGTAAYMSPEQLQCEKLDVRTDLFSFGLVLYEMATGLRAFRQNSASEVPDAVIRQKPKPARSLNPGVSSRLEAIIEKALQNDRESRYQSATELRSDLEILRDELAPSSAEHARRAATNRHWRWFAYVSSESRPAIHLEGRDSLKSNVFRGIPRRGCMPISFRRATIWQTASNCWRRSRKVYESCRQ
jgi:eukaryotic-like serine/threonine-protein kinase